MNTRRRNKASSPHGRKRRNTEPEAPLFESEPVPPELAPKPKGNASTRSDEVQDRGDEDVPFDDDIREVDARDALQSPKRRFPDLGEDRWRWIGIVVLAGVAVFALTQAFRGDDETTAPPEVAAGTSTTTTTSAPVTATPVVTTLPPVSTTTAPTTTAAPTTTTSTTTTSTTTTTTTEPPPFIEPVGEAIPVEELELSINGMGPLDFGDPADQVLGRLAASLGQPTVDHGTVTDGSLGTCEEGTFDVVEFGPLIVITRWENAEETFDMYRVDLRVEDPTGPAAELRTLSGFGAGMTIAELEDIYLPGFRIAYTDHPVEGEIFQLRGASALLLWGPITSSEDDGIVQGIFSESTC